MGNYTRPAQSFTGGIVSGDTSFVGSLSGGTLFSGNTDISFYFEELSSVDAGLQNQINTKANLSGATFTGSIKSGATDLNTYFGNLSLEDVNLQNQINNKASTSSVMTLQTTVTSLQVNVITLETQMSTKANLTGSPLISASALSGTTISGGTFYMTNLPTSDPGIAGQIWNNSGVLQISIG